MVDSYNRPRLIVLIRHGESESNKDKKINEVTPNHLIPLTPYGKKQAHNAGLKLLRLLNMADASVIEKLGEEYALPATSTNTLELRGYKPNGKHMDDNIIFYTSPYKRTRETLKGVLEVIDRYNELKSGINMCAEQTYNPYGKQKHAIWPHDLENSGIYENDESTHCGPEREGTYIRYRIIDEPRLREQDFGNYQEVSSMQDVMEKRKTYGHFFFRFPEGESAADVYDRVASFQDTLYRHFQFRQHTKGRDVVVLVTHGIYSRVFLMKWFRWTYEEFESFTNVPNGSLMVMELDEKLNKYVLRTVLPKWSDLEAEKDLIT
ncbi:Broad-range acid phosphatase DET1 [Nakaseomyces glabratus]|uniref:Broad-range acid phosphatase DET1 n=1 Tax=Candida glabrata TaxID=5478 RepID=A0A0W0E9B2_CANGB|nr:Phosphoglycerate mutase family phosphohistidine signature [Nakaseomyces glabratus]KAH7587938.1 Phosphoglycerate mutase family phosphohistidine signature [Nakaseomyces glabratus]KAH7592324.1 Phosphoglycerate mutase family phosphohistidine signature [Nakaseomyces glabratus]KAH7600970.1 Phosphoglycerate mutase family phosphohistidine signature [Nakaseomyces glabratus]KAH7613409.1 Phosphoglycerate mutase family phosphohistidine signature [Nakaseomyces glabratus]